jgi:hypothetical protein
MVYDKGDTPQFGPWALPPFEDCICQYLDFEGRGIVEVDLLVIIGCRVAGFDHFDSTEERVANKGWANVDTVCRFLQIVVQLVDHGCCCCGSIWKSITAVDTVLVGIWEKSVGSGSCVTDCQGYRTVEDALTNVMEGWSVAPRFVVVAVVFASLVVCAVFVGVAGREIEPHMFAPLTGKEERFRRTRGWFLRFDLASEQGPIVA